MALALRLSLFIAIVVAGTSLSQLQPTALAAGLDVKSKANLKEATRLYKQGQYEEAAKLLTELAVDHPEMANLQRNLGACYYYMRRPEPALSNLRDYLVHKKNDITAEDKAEVERWIDEMEKLRRQPAATASTATAMPTPPGEPAIKPPPPSSAAVPAPTLPTQDAAKEHYEKATRFYELGKYGEAINEYEASYLLVADAELLYNIGQAYRLWERPDDAIRAYENYLRRRPDAVNRRDVETQIANLKRAVEERRQRVVSGRPPPVSQPSMPPPTNANRTGSASSVPGHAGGDLARARNKIVDSNLQAVHSMEAGDFRTARDLLQKTLREAVEAGLETDKMMARTYLHLGAVLFLGYHDEAKAIQNFSLAKRIRPEIDITPRLETPELRAAFERAPLRP
jgi:tetratricopeptide (TPR) repeat protein